MPLKSKFFMVLAIINFLISAVLMLYMYNNNQKNKESLDVHQLENLLEELSERKPHFLVSLLNNSANINASDDTAELEKNVFARKTVILKSGFYIKKYNSAQQKTLIIFTDMTCPHCNNFLKNVDIALNELNCSIVIIPISMLGEKSTYRAKFITAASLQDTKKAFKLSLLLTSDSTDDNLMKTAEKIGLDVVKLSQTIESKTITNTVVMQTKLAEDLHLPGVPTICLLTINGAYFIPPLEANDLPITINNVLQKENE